MALFKYISKRLVTIVLSIVVITIITYCLMYAAPGNFFDIQRFQSMSISSNLTQENAELLRRSFEKKYGLDQPLWRQILTYLEGAVQFKFGPSFSNPDRNIEDLVKEKYPVTLTLGLLAVFLAILFGIPLGILAALKRNTWLDYGATFTAMIGQVIPSYVIAVLFVVLFSVFLGWLPTSGWGSFNQMILPVIALALGPMAVIARFMRVSLLDTLNQDYIRTAYAKGGTDRTVIMKHALRNSLIPIVTVIGPTLAFILAGSAVFIENIFRVPGIGQLFIEAAGKRDYPLLVTSTFVLALTIMLMNLLVDIVYAILDPRIKLE
ncbi:MAG TPA: ABC transporter permease [Bacillota bacterium]|nr:ABC transporter permease [Bacillota bacterium]